MTDIWPGLPTEGQDPWDSSLNNSLTWLHNQVAALQSSVASLQGQVSDLEAKGDYVFSSYPWSFNGGAPPAASGQVRLNNATPSLATMIDLRKTDFDGADRTLILQQVSTGSMIRLSDWDNAAILHRYNVTGPGVVSATNVQFPVTWISGSGAFPTQGQAKTTVAFLVALSV